MSSAGPRSRSRTIIIPSSLLAILGGLVDLPWGIFIKLLDIFWRPRLPPRGDSPRRRRRGLTLVLGGIEGPSLFNHAMVRGILRSGYRGSVVRYDWNRGLPLLRSLVNLMSRRHHAGMAARIIEFIRAYKREHPAAPVSLVSQSGGCWITVRVLEGLPDGLTAATAIMLAPSISSGYDLRSAAKRCTNGLISIGSFGDFVFLGLGTMLLGTSDRVLAPSAGLIGWHHQPPGFQSWRWRPQWMKYGYLGNHTSTASSAFIAAVIGPLLPWRDLARVIPYPL